MPIAAVSRRAREITPFLAMDILERAQELERQGAPVIHLEVGQPDWDTPRVVKEAAFAAMQRGETQYTHSMGLLELREAVCQHYQEMYGVSLTPDRIIATSGTSPAMLLILAALLDPGDEIILTDPHYACYPNFVRLVDAVPSYVKIREEDGFQVHHQDIRRQLTARTKAIFINSPANPTGTVLTPNHLHDVAALGPYVISDEI